MPLPILLGSPGGTGSGTPPCIVTSQWKGSTNHLDSEEDHKKKHWLHQAVRMHALLMTS